MKIHKTNKGYGLLGLLFAALIICILVSLVLSQYKGTLKKQVPTTNQQVNVHQLQKQLNDTMMKHQKNIDNYGTTFQEKH